MSIYVFAFLIGVIAGLRSLTAPAAVSWAARLGWLHLDNTWLAFLGFAATPYLISVLAIGRAARISPQAIMGAAIGLYLFKIIILAIAVKELSASSFFNGKLFGFTALVCILAYCASQVAGSIKFKTLYVEPEPDGDR